MNEKNENNDLRKQFEKFVDSLIADRKVNPADREHWIEHGINLFKAGGNVASYEFAPDGGIIGRYVFRDGVGLVYEPVRESRVSCDFDPLRFVPADDPHIVNQ